MAPLATNDTRSDAASNTGSSTIDQAADAVDMAVLELDLQKSAPRVMKHMNEDHAASLKAYALAFGEHPDAGRTKSAIMTGLDTEGFILELTLADGSVVEDVLVPYDRRIQSAKELHKIAVDMHIQAFAKLGVVYKITSGYYTTAFQMIGLQAYKKAKKRPYETATMVALTIIAAGYGYKRYSSSRALKQ